MRVRKFRAADAMETSGLILRCLREVNSRDYPKKIIDFICGVFSPSKLVDLSIKRTMLVAVSGKTIVGTGSIEGGLIHTVFVEPKLHGGGIGKMLMKKLEGVARKGGFMTLKLNSSITAEGFYDKLGYRKIGRLHDRNFGTTITMTKILRNNA
jgi:GNAT superfamily N-acetyltransferase